MLCGAFSVPSTVGCHRRAVISGRLNATREERGPAARGGMVIVRGKRCLLPGGRPAGRPKSGTRNSKDFVHNHTVRYNQPDHSAYPDRSIPLQFARCDQPCKNQLNQPKSSPPDLTTEYNSTFCIPQLEVVPSTTTQYIHATVDGSGWVPPPSTILFTHPSLDFSFTSSPMYLYFLAHRLSDPFHTVLRRCLDWREDACTFTSSSVRRSRNVNNIIRPGRAGSRILFRTNCLSSSSHHPQV